MLPEPEERPIVGARERLIEPSAKLLLGQHLLVDLREHNRTDQDLAAPGKHTVNFVPASAPASPMVEARQAAQARSASSSGRRRGPQLPGDEL